MAKRTMRRPRGPVKKRRTMNISRPRRLPGMQSTALSFKRTFHRSTTVPSTANTAQFWQYLDFNFGMLPNVTEYTNLFDQYKINGIRVTWRPRYDGFAGNDTTDVTLPGVTAQGITNVHVINDPASRVIPSGTYTFANLNAFLEQGGVKTHKGTSPFSVYLKPTINVQNAVGTKRARAGWLPTDVPTEPHYGFHYFMQDIGMTGVFNQAFDVFYTFYFQCKGAR